MTTCINLQERFGRQYKVVYEESYYAQYGPNARIADPWLTIVPCERGHIFPWAGDKLAASTDRRGPTARKLAALDFVTVAQDGDDGITAVFSIERFADVAALMLPRRRRRLSPEARKAAGERLARFQFRPAVETRFDERPGTQTALDGV